MRVLRLLAVLTAFSALVVAPTPAYACSCVSDKLSELIDPGDVVVRGIVEGRDVKGIPFPLLSSGDEVVYLVEVERAYQGRVGPVVEVESVRSGASCGIEVDVGGEYIVVASPRGGGGLDANLCGGTGEASARYVAEVERSLGPGHPPDASVALPEQPVSVAGWTAGGFGALLLGAALWFLRRRTRKG